MRSQGALVWMFWGREKDKAIVTIIIMDNIIIIINNMIMRGKGAAGRSARKLGKEQGHRHHHHYPYHHHHNHQLDRNKKAIMVAT